MSNNIYEERLAKVLAADPHKFLDEKEQTQKISLEDRYYFKGMDDAAHFIESGQPPFGLPPLMQDATVQERAESLRDKFPFEPERHGDKPGYLDYHKGMDHIVNFVLTGNSPQEYVA